MQDYAIKYKSTYPNSCPPVSQLPTLYNSGSIMHVISFQQKKQKWFKDTAFRNYMEKNNCS